MNGKILKIASNDLYGNQTDRTVSVFAAFNHLKYMNKYAIFAYTDELDKNILHYGSLHLKSNSLVIFEVNKESIPYVDNFTKDYLAGNLKKEEYEIIDIHNIDKVEIVSSTPITSEHLKELNDISIKQEKKQVDSSNQKHNGLLYVILVVMIILLIGVTYLYFNPGILATPLKELKCEATLYNNKIEMEYDKTLDVKFDKNDRPLKFSAIETYHFKTNDEYYSFKIEEKQNEYFRAIGEYKYDDNEHELKVFYEEKTIIDNYKELYNYLKHEGYTCQEGIYNE